ncbi:MAG: tyrosine-type recombinase/integrase [Victivallales bacterium]|nr:tyrosine-type recombinase/integrase [Victivallales bacterium]
MLFKQTGNLKAVQQYLGHKDIATTAKVYAHVLNDDLRNDLNKVF